MTSLTRYVNTTAHTSGDGTTNGTGNGGTNSFVSLNAAITALSQDLTGITPTILDEDGNATIALDIVCSGTTADTTAVDLVAASWVTNATHRLRIRGANPSGALWNASNYRLIDSAAGTAFTIDAAINLTLQDMQMEETATLDVSPKVMRWNGFGWDLHIINGFYIQSATTGTPAGVVGGLYDNGGGVGNPTLHMRNVVVVALGAYANNVAAYLTGAGSPNTNLFLVYNCTFVASGTGATAYSFNDTNTTGTMHHKNLLLQSAGTAYIVGNLPAKESVSILTNDTSSPTVGLRSKTVTFVNAAGRDYHSAGGDPSIGAGTDLSADSLMPFNVDCDGNPR